MHDAEHNQSDPLIEAPPSCNSIYQSGESGHWCAPTGHHTDQPLTSIIASAPVDGTELLFGVHQLEFLVCILQSFNMLVLLFMTPCSFPFNHA
jgi:hypothetical protein